MTTFNEKNEAETKASFSNVLADKAKKRKGPSTERAKYQVSKNNIKNGFCSKRFIIYGENKKEFERYRDELLEFLDPITPIQMDMCFHLIQNGWHIKRLSYVRNGHYNNELKSVLEKYGIDISRNDKFKVVAKDGRIESIIDSKGNVIDRKTIMNAQKKSDTERKGEEPLYNYGEGKAPVSKKETLAERMRRLANQKK